MAKFFKLLILVPVAILVLAFAIANRQTVGISFDPFSNPEASTAIIAGPLFVVLFLTLVVGVILGGVATWFTQGINRRKARVARTEAEQWRDEAMRLRQQPQMVAPTAGRALARSEY